MAAMPAPRARALLLRTVAGCGIRRVAGGIVMGVGRTAPGSEQVRVMLPLSSISWFLYHLGVSLFRSCLVAWGAGYGCLARTY